jgi:hypothetical protein
MELKIKRTELFKGKGQIILPSTPKVKLSGDAKESLNEILADLIRENQKGDNNDEKIEIRRAESA